MGVGYGRRHPLPTTESTRKDAPGSGYGTPVESSLPAPRDLRSTVDAGAADPHPEVDDPNTTSATTRTPEHKFREVPDLVLARGR